MTTTSRQEATRVVFPALDTLRIIGAMCVLTTHAAFWAGAYTDRGVLGTIFARLDVGVAIFFVLSGFLLSRPWIDSAVSGSARPKKRTYFIRRLLRIMPVYLLTALTALTFIRANAGLSPLDWVVTLGLADIYFNDGPPHGLTHTWSLATEVSFYMVLPALMVALLGSSRRLSPSRFSAVLGVGVIINICWLLLAHDVTGIDRDTPLNQWLSGMFLWFAAGIAMAMVDVLSRREPRVPAWARGVKALGESPGVCWVAAGSLLLIAATPVAGPTMLSAPTASESLTKHLIYACVGALMVLPGIFAKPDSTFIAVMSHPRLRYLGHISYGVFCLHVPVLHLIFWSTDLSLFDGNLIQIWLYATAATLLTADVVYRLVERPAMRLGRRTPPPTAASVNDMAKSAR